MQTPFFWTVTPPVFFLGKENGGCGPAARRRHFSPRDARNLARWAIHLHHSADLMQSAHDRREMLRVGNKNTEVNDRKAIGGRRRVDGRHARLRGRERGGDVEHEVEAVLGVNVERGLIRLLDVRAPAHFDPAAALLGLSALGRGVGTVTAVNGHAVAACDEADDLDRKSVV